VSSFNKTSNFVFLQIQYVTVAKGNESWKVFQGQISNIMELSLSAFIRIFIFRLRKYLLYKLISFILMVILHIQYCLQCLLHLVPSGYWGLFPCIMKLTTHIHAVLRLRMSGDVLALPHMP